MKKLFVCAAALGLLASMPVSAQNNDRHGDKHDAAGSPEGHTAPSTGAHQSDQRRDTTRQNDRTMTGNTDTRTVGVRQNTTGASSQPTHTRSVATHAPAANATTNRFLPDSGDAHPSQAVRPTAGRGQNNSASSGDSNRRPPAVNPQNPNWSGNTAGHQSDVSALRRNIRATKQFHGGSYNAPQGYQYRHWGYGERLPRGYFVRNYWIANFTLYGLFAPPSNLIWVRVGDDALLIDQENGDIVQVRYGVFY
jgi:Ni/Co efflux regulator RcnB